MRIQGGGKDRRAVGACFVVGVAASLSWVFVTSMASGRFSVASHIGQCTMLLATALMYRAAPHGTRLGGAACVVAALGTVACTVTLALPGFPAVPGITLAAIGGAANSYLLARWLGPCKRFPLAEALRLTLLAVSLSGAARFGLTVLYNASYGATAAVLSLLPCLSATLLLAMRRLTPDSASVPEATSSPKGSRTPDAPIPRHGAKGAFAAVAVEFAAYGLLFGFLRMGINDWSSLSTSMLLGYFLRIVVPLVLLAWESSRLHMPALRVAVQGATIAMALCLLFALFFGNAHVVLSGVTLAARGLVSLLVYLRVFSLMRRFAVHPIVAYCSVRSVYEAAYVTGLIACDGLMAGLSSYAMWFEGACFAVSCALLLLLFGFMRTDRGTDRAAETAAPSQVGTFDLLDKRLTDLAVRFELSSREAEVMHLAAKGYTKRHIAENLCLSEDTIRYYTKQFYRKLGIHSRQDLLALVEARKDEA